MTIFKSVVVVVCSEVSHLCISIGSGCVHFVCVVSFVSTKLLIVRSFVQDFLADF
jgi:hypothetical protein